MSCNGQSKKCQLLKKKHRYIVKSTHLYADVCVFEPSKFKLNPNLWIHTVDRCVTNRGYKSHFRVIMCHVLYLHTQKPSVTESSVDHAGS